MRYALRRDDNERAVIDALEAAGARVWVIGQPVDLLISFRGRIAAMEVKDGAKVPSARKKTDQQDLFFKVFAGSPVFLVDSPECALRHLNVLGS